MKIEFCWRQIFEILIIHKTEVTRGPTKKLSQIGSAVSTFKIQANNPTDRQTKYIYICIDTIVYNINLLFLY